MERISEVATTCTKLAIEVKTKFDDAILLTGELLEVCTGTKGAREADIKKMKNNLKCIRSPPPCPLSLLF
jgi:hypothetical protein